MPNHVEKRWKGAAKKSSTRQRKSIEQDEVPTYLSVFIFFRSWSYGCGLLFCARHESKQSFFSHGFLRFVWSTIKNTRRSSANLQSTSARSATQVGRLAPEKAERTPVLTTKKRPANGHLGAHNHKFKTTLVKKKKETLEKKKGNLEGDAFRSHRFLTVQLGFCTYKWSGKTRTSETDHTFAQNKEPIRLVLNGRRMAPRFAAETPLFKTLCNSWDPQLVPGISGTPYHSCEAAYVYLHSKLSYPWFQGKQYTPFHIRSSATPIPGTHTT